MNNDHVHLRFSKDYDGKIGNGMKKKHEDGTESDENWHYITEKMTNSHLKRVNIIHEIDS